jgi:hypothetical protein
MIETGRHFWVLPLLAGIGCVVGLFIDPHTLLACYLAAVVAVSAIPLGALAVLMVSYLVRGEWTEGLHPALTAAASTMPIAGLLFVPVVAGMPWLYPWAAGDASASVLQAIYLTPWFFVARTIIYFIVWTALALWVRQAWGDLARMMRAASAGLIVYALTASFAGIDWIQSLTPTFHSSTYGLLFITFQLLAGLAFGLVIALRPGRARPTFSYGPILLSVLLLWAYIHAMQYIIVWAADIPDEVVWYLRRSSDGWGIVVWAMVFLQFVVPFFAMLSQRVRNGQWPLVTIAGATLALRMVEALWLILPSTGASGPVLLLAIPATMVAIAGTWWIAFRAGAHRAALTRHSRLAVAAR